MKRAGLWLLVGSISLSAQAETIHFEQIEKMVLSQNAQVEVRRQNLEAKKSRQGYFKRSFLPEVIAEVSQETLRLGREESKNQSAWKMEAELNVFRGGADLKEEKVRSHEAGIAAAEVRLTEREQLQKAYELYWQLLFQQERVETLKNHLELSRKNLSEANRRIGAGVATATDRLEFETQMPLIRQDISLAEVEIRRLSSELGLILGVENVAATRPSAHGHVHDWETKLKVHASETLPEVRLVQNEKESLQAKADVLRAGYLPRVDLYAGYAEPNQRYERDFPDPTDRRESYVGVRASWSLRDAVEGAVERSSLQKELRAKNQQERLLARQLSLKQDNLLHELRALHSFVHDLEENIKITHRYLESTRREYARGVKNSPDVLAATEKYIHARLRLAEVVRDFNIKYSSQLAVRN